MGSGLGGLWLGGLWSRSLTPFNLSEPRVGSDEVGSDEHHKLTRELHMGAWRGSTLCKVTPVILHGVVSPDV